jgi:hypothetical protein
MGLLKFIFIATFSLALVTFSLAQVKEDCSSLSAKVNKSFTEDSGNKIEIQVEGATAPVKYIFYDESGKLLSEDFDSKTIAKIEKGKYFCVVSDARPCRITVEFEIE